MIRRSGFLPILLATLLSVALVACRDENPTVNEKFVAAFVEMRVIEQTYGADSPMCRLARGEVLKKYGFTREAFQAEAQRILDDPSFWMPFQNRVVDRIDSTLDPEAYIKKKEEEAKAKKSKSKSKRPKPGEEEPK